MPTLPARTTFQTKFFLAALSAAVIALGVAGVLFATAMRRQIDARIEETLIAETRLAAELLMRSAPMTAVQELDAAADRIGQLIGARVTLIARVADRYRQGDLTPPRLGFGDDEMGTVARALDESVQEVGRRLAEQARDRARMEAILAGMVEGVIVLDPQARLQLVNEAARRMLKLPNVAVGRQYAETIRVPAIAELVAEVLLGHKPEALQLSPPRDPSRAIMARAAPAAGSAEHGVILVLHDITDLRRADQIRRDFVANVSHELRTPLTAIRGYVEALSEEDTNAEERGRFLEIIGRHTQRMERLVKDLLRLARLEAGQEQVDLVAGRTPAATAAVVRDPA